MKRLVLVLVAALTLVGCGPSVDSGEVVTKHHYPLTMTTTYI